MSEIRMRKTMDGVHRVGIPKDIWHQMGWNEGTVLEFWRDGDVICMRKVDSNVDALNHLNMLHWDIANMNTIPAEKSGTITKKIEELRKEIDAACVKK